MSKANKTGRGINNAPGVVAADTHVHSETISPSDREVLRPLAGEVAALAAREIEKEKRVLWTRHNDLQAVRPLIFCDPENGWNEIITPDQLHCTGDLARSWEHGLRKEIFWGKSLCDDRVIEPYFNVGCVYARTDWGLRERNIGGEHGGARTWEPPIKNLDDLGSLHFQTITPDAAATERRMDLAGEVLGDLLPIRPRNYWYWTLGLTWELIRLRGMETMMMDMYDNPAGLHRLMAFLRDGTGDFIDQIERQGLFTLNNEGDYVGSGGFGWTKQLPAAGFAGKVRTQDLWCLSESQETVGVGPELFEEFVFQYQLPIMQRFGLVCYGCCEPVHNRWHVIKKIPNLRRVSVSPWCDRAKMAENLADRYVYSLKAHPALLAAPTFDESAIRADIRDAMDKARGCHVEIIMKDNHTICRQPQRVIDWVRITREEILRK